MKSRKSHKKQYELTVAISLALSLGWEFLPAEAAVQTAPLTITDKNQVINDDFNVNPAQDNFSVIKADSSVSGGTITINSKKLHAEGDNLGALSKNALIRTTGSSVYGQSGFNQKDIGLTKGYEGTITLTDGMEITGYVKGNGTSTMGIYEEGYDKLGTVFNNVTKNGFHRYIYSNDNGKPAAVTVNVGKNTKISLTGVQQPNQSGQEEDRYFRNFAICNDGGNLNVGDSSKLSATAYGRYAVSPVALYNSKYGVTNLGSNVTLAAKGVLTARTSGNGAEVYGLISRHDHVGDDESDVNGRQTVTAGDNLTVNADLSCNDIDYDNPYSLMDAAVRLGYTDLLTGKNATLHTIQDDKGLGTYALYANHTSTAAFGDNFKASVEAKGTTYGVYGFYAQGGSAITLQGKAATTINAAGSHQAFGMALYGSSLKASGDFTIQMTSRGYSTQTIGLYLEKDPSSGDVSTVDATGGKLSINLDVQGDAVKDKGYYNQETTQYVSDTAHLNALANDGGTAKLGEADFSLAYKGNMTEKTEVRGLGTLAGGTTTATGPVELNVSAENTGTKAVAQLVYGVANTGSTVTLSGPVTASVTAENVGEAYGVRTADKGYTEIGNGSSLTLSADADKTAVVRSENGGVTTFSGSAILHGAETALSSSGEGSQINLKEKGTKIITGNLLSEDNGSIDLDMNDKQSVLTGKSAIEKGITNLSLSQGSLWNMTGGSTVTNLKLNSGAIINMTANKNYQVLQAGYFSGQNGNLLMKTDLASETNGDKMTIASAAAGSAAKVAVDDASLYNGQEVTGVKNLLLITDASKNASFTGQYLDKGGLWDVTPEIQRGDTVKDASGKIIGDATQWYLTKVIKKANPDTRPLLKSADNDYALYRNSIDTLRQRLGELRFWQNASQAQKDDNSGIWARDTYSSYAGHGLESKENRFQLGFDRWSDRKSVYGVFGERGIANPHYAYGAGKDHSLAGAAYGTWFGDNGSYTDVVAKAGRNDVDLHTSGSYPDKADYRTWERSLSVEYGRTHTLNDHGLFLEPQAQLVFGHLDGEDYTTSRGKTMHMDSFNSEIGRLGFVFGQRRPEAVRPFDYYLKASLLHEFGGSRDFYLTAPDGETMSAAGHYRDTWYELGFGGTYHMNDHTYLYADASRTYGGTWNQKWRWNAGVQWSF